MCGIAGVVRWGRDTADLRTVERLLTAFEHRGPDSRGTVSSGPAALGAVRLSLVDVAGSDQPISYRAAGVHLVFNGEIYNHARLRKDLESAGHRFLTCGDGEVILASYLRDAESFTERLDGMYAFAIWDARRETLTVGRDRMGIKPLYLYAAQDRLVFSSELRSLVADPHVPVEVSRDAAADYFTVRFSPPACSPLTHVRKIEPGTTVVFDRQRPSGMVRESRWLRFPAFSAAREPQGCLATELRESVSTTLPPDAPAAAFLSGGLDSATVSALAAQQRGTIDVFSVGYAANTWQDETGYAGEIARHIGARHDITHLTESNVQETFLATLRSMDEPIYTPVCLSTHAVSGLAARQHKAVLAGDGSDELLMGYAHMHEAHQAALRGEPWRDRYWNALGWWTDDDRRRVLDDDMLKRCAPDVSQERFGFAGLAAGGADAAEVIRWFEVTAKLPGYHLPRVDQLSMTHGLEVRVPFLRDGVVDWALARPARSLMTGRPKEVLRSVARGLVPASIVDRPKQKFSAPASVWLAGPLRDLTLDLLHEGAGAEELGLEAAGLARLAGDFHRDPSANTRTVWGIVVLLGWYRALREHIRQARGAGAP
ncbi:Asparagine synthetase [glutamine-hydrolyzing] [[Actinomadura] parvosata subsp. kistnae]|uniref:asparagine synthase (glutamine-hydrolyzing) n=1 Tax=[Actinomadura] parvosata subsp. kistnae TaxID=1909395 RepID=A0A1U9ZWY7_9ACTN|nr:asparagine synthase (glutamine-hydrolyzing) [Nonomuraea sp. ATCC 55076]SPL88698.1 Asparagine synthetase [glutamine-hydrolyzing] [Actinomadura parvosata subsp. kistnae]